MLYEHFSYSGNLNGRVTIQINIWLSEIQKHSYLSTSCLLCKSNPRYKNLSQYPVHEQMKSRNSLQSTYQHLRAWSGVSVKQASVKQMSCTSSQRLTWTWSWIFARYKTSWYLKLLYRKGYSTRDNDSCGRLIKRDFTLLWQWRPLPGRKKRF